MHPLLLNSGYLAQSSLPASYTSVFPYASKPSEGGLAQAAHPILLPPSQPAKAQQKDGRKTQNAHLQLFSQGIHYSTH